MSKFWWQLQQVVDQLWFRSVFLSAIAIAVAVLGLVIGPYVPVSIARTIGSESVETILGIISSSMLAVTTFSLSTMVNGYAAASSGATPRATGLLMRDATSMNVMAVFIGAFIYSLLATILLTTGVYDPGARVVVFASTLVVVTLVVVTLLRWVDYVRRLGRVGETTNAVYEVARTALQARAARPYMGGRPGPRVAREQPVDALPVYAGATGYVQHIAVDVLQSIAERLETSIDVVSLPGAFVSARSPIAYVQGARSQDAAELEAEVADAFSIERSRTFDQDPRFGIIAMSEIASRALSPAVNDPGTAIDVIGRMVMLFDIWSAVDRNQEPKFDRVRVPGLAEKDLFDDAFAPIARDGAAIPEVQIRLQKAFAILTRSRNPAVCEQAYRHSQLAMKHAEQAIQLTDDLERVRAALDRFPSYRDTRRT
ncbi:MAG: DUF2254 domain-containing protein [Hyphomicrobiaceae bacterium]